MFTVKLMSFKGDAEYSHNISCMAYSACKHPEGIYTITVFPTMLETDGVEYWVGDREGHEGYHLCYVENEAGKTIANFSKRT
jgi:hypothetical protein